MFTFSGERRAAPAGSRLVGLIAITALSYFVSGRLGLLLAIPPGYATPIWPPSGVALALMLLSGYRIWPGIILGSYAVNASLGLDTSSAFNFISSSWVPLTIGCGAALQAVVGRWLICRYIGSPLLLDRATNIARFLLLGPIISCMVNATIGTSVLVAANVVDVRDVLFHWVTWWAGDAIGVLIFTVFLLAFFYQGHELWRRRRIAVGIPLAVNFVALTYLFFLASGWEVSRQKAEIGNIGSRTQADIVVTRERYLEILRGIAGYISVRGQIDQTEFKRLAAMPLSRESGFRALEWVPVVKRDEVARYQNKAEREGLEGFYFKELNGSVFKPVESRDTYYPVLYVEPAVGNNRVLGFDLGSNIDRMRALVRAADSRDWALTETVSLVQETTETWGALMVVPVFKRPATAGEPESLLGFVIGVVRIDTFMGAALSGSVSQSLVITVSEQRADGERIVYGGAGLPADESIHAASRLAIDMGGREWVLQVEPTQAYLAESRTIVPWALLLGGLLFNGLLGTFLLQITGEVYRTKLSEARLKETQAQLIESEKLASLGRMMSGLAHELNTPMGVAVTATSTVAHRCDELEAELNSGAQSATTLAEGLESVRKGATIAQKNIERAARLVNSFKEVAVDQASEEVRRINLNRYVKEIFEYSRPMYRKSGHNIILDIPENIVMKTRPGALSQVLINLLNNSLLHAFADDEQGEIRLSASVSSGHVFLRHEDDGCGILPEHQHKVFEPFFTTRRGQGGTGLGLHLVRKLVREQLGGTLKLTSNAAGGAVFLLELPLAGVDDPVSNGATKGVTNGA